MLLTSVEPPKFRPTGCHSWAGTEIWGGECHQLLCITQEQEEEQLGLGVGGNLLHIDRFLQLGFFLRLLSGDGWKEDTVDETGSRKGQIVSDLDYQHNSCEFDSS